MKSIILSRGSDGKLGASLQEVRAPDAGPGELVVTMKACGLCGTDLEKLRGEYAASMPVLGHEAVGVVSGVGDGVEGFRKGDRVFPHHHVPCYDCDYCRSGDETMCDMYRKSNLHPGGFSEKILVHEWNVAHGGVLKLPDEMSFEAGTLIEPVACCLRAVKKYAKPGETALVVGAGPVGLMIALLLRPMVVKVILSDVSPARLEFAKKMDLGDVIDAAKVDVTSMVRGETRGMGADVAIIATGSGGAILQGLRAIRRGGRACLFGVPPKGTVLDYDVSDLYNSGQQLVTSYAASDADTKEAMGEIASNPEFARLITHRYPLVRFDDAVRAATTTKAVKVIVTP